MVKGWIEKPLSKLFDFSGGLSASRAQLSNKGYPYLHYGDIHGTTLTYVDCSDNSIPRLDVEINNVSNASLLKDGDVVFVDASEDDEGASRHVVVRNTTNIPFISGLHTIIAKAKTDELDNSFREFCFQAKDVKAQFKYYAVGTKVTGVNKVSIGKIKICFPESKPEQRHIASALSDMDELITAMEKLIAKKRNIKQGTMQELLTGKRRLPGFSGEWDIVELGSVVDIFRGGSPRPIQAYITSRNDGINWIKIGDVAPNAKYIISTEERIIPEGVAYSRTVSKGDFILSNSMSFGRPYILNIDGCIHDGWLTIQNYHDSFDTDFLYYLLGSETIIQQYINMAAGSSVQNLNKEKVSKVIVCKPSKPEQTAIAEILSDMDTEIDVLTARLNKLRNIKQGMMSELLTGRIRLMEDVDNGKD